MIPVQITVRDIPSSTLLEDNIRKKALKLDHFYKRIQRVRVVIQVSQKHKHQGKLYSVHMDLAVPGKELVVNRKWNEDVYIAIRDAFLALQRQLEAYARKRRGEVKNHEDTFQGKVKRIFKEEGYGFIVGRDGTEYYFSAPHVASPAFQLLESGDLVHFMGEPTQDGFQAYRVMREKMEK